MLGNMQSMSLDDDTSDESFPITKTPVKALEALSPPAVPCTTLGPSPPPPPPPPPLSSKASPVDTNLITAQKLTMRKFL